MGRLYVFNDLPSEYKEKAITNMKDYLNSIEIDNYRTYELKRDYDLLENKCHLADWYVYDNGNLGIVVF